jgi:copper transport outer membrane protein MctB
VISFRYHIVTIVAVFLALAIGLLGGSAFVQPALQRDLERRTDAYRGEISDLRKRIADLSAESDGMTGFANSALPYLTRDRLLGARAVIIAQDGVEGSVVDETQRSLTDAGADVVATITAEPSIASTNPDDQARLAQILGMPAGTEVGVDDVADALAGRLATARVSPSDAEGDVLGQLLSAGYLTASDGTPLEDVGGPEQVIVVLGGGPLEQPTLDPDGFGPALVSSLVDRELAVAAGESSDTPPDVSFVQAVRGSVGDAVVTVDDLDRSMGGAALVLGIDQLRRTSTGGAYGLGEGTEPLPALP